MKLSWSTISVLLFSKPKIFSPIFFSFKSPRSSTTTTPLNFHTRTPLITTGERPNSSCLSLGRTQPSLETDMAKSVDSALSLVKCYQQEGRSKSQNTPTKIYTPRECYECEFMIYLHFRSVESLCNHVDRERNLPV